jgi:ABC-type multidrug transport system fused ATPase/permease subunit
MQAPSQDLARPTKPSISIARDVLFDRIPWRILIIATSFIAACLSLGAAGFQKYFIDSLSGSFQAEEKKQIIFLLCSFVCFVFSSLLTQLNNYWGLRESLLSQKKLSQRLYERSLTMKSESLEKKTVGEMVALYATDIPASAILLEQTLPFGASTFFPLFLTPFALDYLVGTPLLETCGLVVLVAVVNTILAIKQSKFFLRFKDLAALRTSFVNEWIQNIRTLKILNWLDAFEDRIFKVREHETVNRIQMVTNGQVMNSLTSHSTFLFNIAAGLSLIWIYKRTLTPGEIWTVFWILGILLNRPLRQLPWFFTFAFDAKTSSQRLENFFKLTSFSDYDVEKKQPLKTNGHAAPLLEVEKLTWIHDDYPVLENLDFKMNEGDKIAILGDVGSGKSAFLLCLMGELHGHFQGLYFKGQAIQGKVTHNFRRILNYVPQESFLMNSTLRDNISFEYEMSSVIDPELDTFLNHVDFNPSFEGLTDGLDTRIGERGVNLSGGQRQRLSIARSIVQDRPFILIDDSMSQLDAETEKKILTELFEGPLKDKTVIFTTHRRSVLNFVSKVYEMRDGKLHEVSKEQAMEVKT